MGMSMRNVFNTSIHDMGMGVLCEFDTGTQFQRVNSLNFVIFEEKKLKLARNLDGI